MSYVLILGASSDIAKAVAVKFAHNGYDLYLAGRDLKELEMDAADLQIRYSILAKAVEYDAVNFESHHTFYHSLDPKPGGMIFVVGYLGDQKKAECDFQESRQIIDSNYTSLVSIGNLVATDFEERKAGFIIAISSVAGDRGRQSNYVYGSAKAAATAYLSGLRGRLFNSNVPVITVIPGFVNTRMTEGMELPKKLVGEPDQVADDIYRAWKRGEHVVYTRWYWRYIMLLIKIMPESLFKKMNI
ncbi:MAG: SDR family oxidoreductase [Proteobacteria bacterium]|nr:SDR family oxidoreductase [Pseudomonadota bacterium]